LIIAWSPSLRIIANSLIRDSVTGVAIAWVSSIGRVAIAWLAFPGITIVLRIVVLIAKGLGAIIVGGWPLATPIVVGIPVGRRPTITRSLAEGGRIASTAVVVVPVLIPTTPGGGSCIAIVRAGLQVIIKGKGFFEGIANLP
jgi:hypothetical protein